ncbi:hypothetical protein [Nonomuraea sp. NPDC048826]|uniref:hypothetical protein n=1 Tax=Nonomuraea sp. NPDC048826 TaxID=3364347 RepID=UPI003721A499
MIRLLALGLVVSVAAGCAGAPPAPGPVAGSVDDLVLPFDAYKPAPGQRALLDTARRALVTRCLSRRGGRRGPVPLAPPDPGNSRRYGVADPAQAAEFGYHLPAAQAEPAGSGKRAKKARRHPAGLRACEERAAVRLASSGQAPWTWLARRDARTLERSAARPEVRQAVTGWVACMRSAGHPYPSPEAAIGDPRWALDKPVISADEKRTAIADTACKWSSGLVARWFAADAALQRRLVHKHAGRFALLRADLNERVRRATTLLDRS